MKTNYEIKLKTLLENYQILKSEFKWEQDLNLHLIALNYVLNDKPVEVLPLKEMKDFLKQNTKMFSPFRSTGMFALCGLLASENDMPKMQLKFMMDHLDMAKEVGFKSASYLPVALYTLDKVYDGSDVNVFLQKAINLYKEMKSNHPFLTGGDDYALAILLASNDCQPSLIEPYYNALNKAGFSKSNGLQMMSHILSFNPENVDQSVNKCVNIFNVLKQNKLKLSADYYSAIALMSLLPGDLTGDLIEVSLFLNRQKGYKWLGKGMNVLIASALIAGEFVNDQESDMMTATLQISIQSIIAAQQAAMIAATCAITAAAATSASS
jgi:hypothetical protein